MIEEEIITATDIEPPQDLAADALLPAVVRPEINFLELPLFALHHRGLKERKETVYRFVEERDGKKVEFTWQVIPSTKYGHPTPFDRRVARAIDALIDETFVQNGYRLENPIRFSIYRLAELMGRKSSTGGRLYKDIKESLLRIKFTGVESRGAYYLKDEEVWVERAFTPYQDVVFTGMRKSDGTVAETNYLELHDLYLRNINARHVRPLNYTFLASLKNDIAGRLYEVLGPKFYGLSDNQPYYHVDYIDHCKRLPITPQKYYSDASRKLKPAHQELGSWGFLTKVAYVLHDGSKKVKTIRYYPGWRAKREMSGDLLRRAKVLQVEEQPLLADKDKTEKVVELTGIAKELYDRGVSEGPATRLAQRYSEDRIREKIEMFDFLKSSQNFDNPAGWLRQAVEEDWKPTEAQLKAKEAHEQGRKERERKQRWLKHREELIEQMIKEWDNRVEEIVKGVFHLWLTAFHKGDPNSEEAKAKKQEYIDRLPKTEEERRDYLETRYYPTEPPKDFV